MKVRKASAKTELHSNIMNTEIIYNFYTDHQDFEIVTDFANLGSVIHSNGACSQEIKKKLRIKRAAIELGKVTKSTDASLETRAKIIHTRGPHYFVQMWKVDSEEADREKNVHVKYGVGEPLCRHPGPPERWTRGSYS